MNCKDFLFLFLITSSVTFGQTKIGGDPNEINSGSLLELEDSARGLLLPRILLDDIDQWSLLGTPVDGMVIASEGGTVPDGIYHWNDGAWHILSGDFTESITILTDNQDGTLTYTNEAGNQVTIVNGGSFSEVVYVANEGQAVFVAPSNLTDVANLNVFRNGSRVGFTVLGTNSIQLELEAICFADDEIRVIQYAN